MKIGIIGAGKIGGTLGTLWAQAGHQVKFGTRNPASLQALVERLSPNASAGTGGDAASFGEVILFAAPYGSWPEFAASSGHSLNGKVVMDAANPYSQRDGEIAIEAAKIGAGSYTARLLPQSRVVKAFNTIFWSDLCDQAHRSGDPLGVPLAGDHHDAIQIVAKLTRDSGFEPVVIGGMLRASLLDPGSAIYGKSLTAADLKRALGTHEAQSKEVGS